MIGMAETKVHAGYTPLQKIQILQVQSLESKMLAKSLLHIFLSL